MTDYDKKGNGEIQVCDIQSFFSGGNVAKHLVDCPKVMILDACRGSIRAEAIEDTSKGNQTIKLFHPAQDFAVIYSNALGYKSFCTKNGAYFTLSVSKILSDKQFAAKNKLGDLVKMIRKETHGSIKI
eukprot:UN00296